MTNKKSHQESVAEFMIACGQYDPKVPDLEVDNLTPSDVLTSRLRLKLTIEEVAELFEAFVTPQVYEDYFNPLFNQISDNISLLGVDNLEIKKSDIADAITDIDYVNVGLGVWLNLPLEECFTAVHANNMTKVDPITGKVTRNSDGKIMKPIGFQPVDLETVLEDYSFNGN